MNKFSVGDSVVTFDPNFEPEVKVDTVGKITNVITKHPSGNVGYDVVVPTTLGTEEELFFFEYELTETK